MLLDRVLRTASPPLHEYTQNVIFDPCRGYAAGCCMNNFGTPEWELISADPAAADYFLQFTDGQGHKTGKIYDEPITQGSQTMKMQAIVV